MATMFERFVVRFERGQRFHRMFHDLAERERQSGVKRENVVFALHLGSVEKLAALPIDWHVEIDQVVRLL